MLYRTLALVLLLAACQPDRTVSTAPAAPEAPRGSFRQQPPPSMRGDRTVVVSFTTVEEIQRQCDNPRAIGCTVNDQHIFVPNPCFVQNGGDYALLLCHELGHVNFWPGNHPYENDEN